MPSTKTTSPPLLTPYLHLPPELSLTLLTSTLGCTVTWLATRFIATALSPTATSEEGGEEEEPEEEGGDDTGSPTTRDGPAIRDESSVAVLVVSWMRDEAFWRGEVRRCVVSVFFFFFFFSRRF
jgi:elongator complex protein 6